MLTVSASSAHSKQGHQFEVLKHMTIRCWKTSATSSTVHRATQAPHHVVRCPVLQVVSKEFVDPARAMAAARNASHAHSYTSYPLKYELFPKDMADMAKANSIKAMAIGFKVLAAMTDMVIGDQQLLQVNKSGSCTIIQDALRMLVGTSLT